LQSGDYLLLTGASVRSAAFSALRAGLRPWCADLFADADLRLICQVLKVPAGCYPDGLVELFATAPPGPWLYTGALENRPRLVDRLSRGRILWGNRGEVLRRVRSPFLLAECLKAAGLPHPVVRRSFPLPSAGRWLAKPRDGAGGRGITFLRGKPVRRRGRWYFQQYIEGEAQSAIYRGDGERVRLLGVTRQLVGESWLHAGPFRYCGSIGPLPLTRQLRRAYLLLGQSLVAGFGLRGLFGVDCVVRDGVPYPVEVNPRYTASMEVLEHALGVPLMALHRQVFDPVPPSFKQRRVPGFVGKAILFARQALTFPAEGPWSASLHRPANLWKLPAFADIPAPGTSITARRPVLTYFAQADSVAACLQALRQKAAELDGLFGGLLPPGDAKR
jgi:predicted ATP-grasp superfamily ATP-dependent carboligase